MQSKLENTILIYCDGACSGNPGPGGWGAIIATPDGQVVELGGRSQNTTNNQMELQAVISSLKEVQSAPAADIIIYTDSTYVIRGITQWIWGWMRKDWKTAEGKEVLNKEYWQKLSSVVGKIKKTHSLDWKYVRGHTGSPGNERCDEIAVKFSKGLNVNLYEGSLLKYGVPVYDFPPDVPLPEMRERTEKIEAYSYLSLIGTIPMRHSNWAECERRVKGQSGAKFKKAMSAEEEVSILNSWGIDPKKLKV